MIGSRETLGKVTLKNREHHTLLSMIYDDLFYLGRLPLCMFIFIVVTALIVVSTTYHTRLLTVQLEKLMMERDSLYIEWCNLILEKTTLCDHSRIERIAVEKLRLQHIDSLHEKVVLQR